MTVLVGGMRVLNVNHSQSKHGIFTDQPDLDQRLAREPARRPHRVEVAPASDEIDPPIPSGPIRVLDNP